MKGECEVENYKPNSHKSKEANGSGTERKKLEKVVGGTAKIKKKSTTRKFTDALISEDAANVKSYIFSDVLIPAAKKLVSDIVRDGIEMILYGSTGNRDSRSRGFRGDYVSYDKYSRRRDDRRYESDRSVRSGYSYDDIVLETKGDAEAVLDRLGELIDRYGQATVLDLYDIVGITGRYTDDKFGWMDIRNADSVRVRDGYLLRLPKALALD